jgi:N-acyl-D-amino-acid deacylase
MYDIIVKSTKVYDGTGKDPFVADVGVKDGKIATVGTCDGEATVTIPGGGVALMPGCIDAHSHSDLSIPVNNRAECSIYQGITTEVAGSCGWGLAPCKDETIQSVMTRFGWIPVSVKDIPWQWHTFGEYLTALEKIGIGTNQIPIVGQSIIRAHVVGTENRPASKGEIEAMKALVREAMEEGARGLSAGRSYEPGRFGNTDEIVELCKVVSEYGGVYTCHLASEGQDLFPALQEAIDIGRRANVSVEVSHHKDIGRANFGKVNKTLRMMEEAREQGVQISCDVYPYFYSQISMMQSMLPVKFERMEREELYQKLDDPAVIAEMRSIIGSRLDEPATWGSDWIVVYCPGHPEAEFKTLPEIAGKEDRLSVVIRLLKDSKMAGRFASLMDEQDVQTVIKHPMTAIGTDAWALDGYQGDFVAVHPRNFGTFPRVLGHYARDLKLTSLQEMIRKCTSLTAHKFHVADRGVIKEGNWADLMVFNPDTIVDAAVPSNPYKKAPGIEYVIVNGKIALEKGEYKPVLAGKAIRR